MSNYSEKLKDTRWKNKRIEILRHCENICNGCGNNKGLHVHHLIYHNNKEPWEYSKNELTVLCNYCHNEFHKNDKSLRLILSTGRFRFTNHFKKTIEVVNELSNIDEHSFDDIINYIKTKQ